MNQVSLPKNQVLATKVLEGQERGRLGNIFGTKDHAPTNIGAVALICLILLLALVLFAQVADGVDRNSIITALMSAITFTLGLIFGRGSSGSTSE